MHDTALIGTIAAGLGLAFVLGLVAVRLKLPPLVGYLLAGVVLGPFTPGFVADADLARQLSEIGIILLMFGVGIHFSVADLLSVRKIALRGAVVQSVAATALGAVVARVLGWSWGSGIVFGLCLSVASTVVLLRALEDRGLVDSADGRIAVGWLIVEDLFTVLVLVLLPLTATSSGAGDVEPPAWEIAVRIGTTLLKVAAFVALMFIVGRRVVPWLLAGVAKTGSRELFTLALLAVSLGIGVGAAALFDVSFALAAFFAGMVVNGSDLSHEAAEGALPLRDAFSVLFFVAVGMLFDPMILATRPLEVLAVVAIVIVCKSVAAFFIVLFFRHPLSTALTISASLAQIGEFSFILAALAVSLGLLGEEGQGLIVAGALISITLNPAMFSLTTRLNRFLNARPSLARRLERDQGALAVLPAPTNAPSGHVILVGFGRVGSVVGETLAAEGISHVVIERSRDAVADLRAKGRDALLGNAARALVLEKAGVARARLLIITTPDPFEARAMLEAATAANPNIDVVARTHSTAERDYLERHGAGLALVGEHELALGIADYALDSTGCDPARTNTIIEALRRRRTKTAQRPGTARARRRSKDCEP